MSGGHRKASDTAPKKNLKKLKKGVDKHRKVWYNNSVLKRGRTKRQGHDPGKKEVMTMATNMKNENKMTYVTALEWVLNGDLPDDVREKLSALREQTMKRNAASKVKPTKVQEAEKAIQSAVVDALRDAPDAMTVSDLVQALPSDLNVHTTQKLSPVVTKMVEAGTLTREMKSRKAYFRLA